MRQSTRTPSINVSTPNRSVHVAAPIRGLPLTVAEYFAGIGLVRMGLEACGWRVAFANDISEKKYEMYKAFFPDAKAHYVVRDIFKVDAATVPPATLATCSFPCIDLSLAGNMNGMINGNHSSAFWGFVKTLEAQGESAPPLVLVENVPGWLYSNKGIDFSVTVQALNKLGYACDVFTLDALRFTPKSLARLSCRDKACSHSHDCRIDSNALKIVAIGPTQKEHHR
jgi:DNA (cytosine-5)-methyltransferase 1